MYPGSVIILKLYPKNIVVFKLCVQAIQNNNRKQLETASVFNSKNLVFNGHK